AAEGAGPRGRPGHGDRDRAVRGAEIEPEHRSGALLAHQDVRGAHAAAAHHVTESRARVRHLALARLAAQLQRRLPDLRQAGRAAGMAAGSEPTVGRERHRTARREPALLDALLGLALATEPEQLVVLQLLDDERVVHLHELDVLRAEARLLVEVLRGVAAHLRRPDHRPHEEMAALVDLAPEVRRGD